MTDDLVIKEARKQALALADAGINGSGNLLSMMADCIEALTAENEAFEAEIERLRAERDRFETALREERE